uniref:CHCH domain-containing protein n=1 Tax=Megaselia scalaris TaxID=36166 RepID=T1GEX9_MEGSC
MGARQSSEPRTVNLGNDSPLGVIDVSDDVVKRLKQGLATKAAASTTAPVEKQETVVASPAPSRAPEVHTVFVPASGYREPSLTAIELKKKSEQQLRENDLYWRQRMNALEGSLNKTNAIMEKEYSKAVEDVKKQFADAPAQRQLPPCQDLKAKLIACYRSCNGETLKCSEAVEAFTECVSKNRVQRIEAVDKKEATAATSKVVPAKAG